MINRILLSCVFLLTGNVCASTKNFSFSETKDQYSFAQFYVALDSYSGQIEFTADTNNGDATLGGHSVTIGGIHYWGMADFYVKFPIPGTFNYLDINTTYSPGVLTGFKYYPFRLKNHGIRPFLGAGFSFPSFEQKRNGRVQKLTFPAEVGLSYTSLPFMIDLSVMYQSVGTLDFYQSQDEVLYVEPNEMLISLSARWLKDLSIHGRTKSNKQLSQGIHYYVGIGPTSSWLMNDVTIGDSNARNSSIYNSPRVSADLAGGIEWKWSNKKGNRTIFNAAWRPMSVTTKAFGVTQEFSNSSLALEVMQAFGDYKGFVPYIGLSGSFNTLKYTLSKEGSSHESSAHKTVLGIIFGWDIIPNPTDVFILRTNLRYYPKVAFNVEDHGEIQLPNFEFNFIQAIFRF